MLNDTVLSFLRMCNSDKSLQKRLGDCDIDSLLVTARTMGYYFTEEEFKSTISTLVFNDPTDEELDMIAGGAAGGGGEVGTPVFSSDNPIFSNPAFLIRGL
ncbi:MAG TPA: Nif11-like leader peptide family natural product precursor [Aggregatilineales bacterium]|nr:Nif11-like leader peptide family natural product precursor [Aggregatilineales bacterium]